MIFEEFLLEDRLGGCLNNLFFGGLVMGLKI